MLKPNKDPLQEADDESSIGEVVSQLFDEGKAYAKAEVDLVKAQALAKVTVALALVPMIGPLGGGLIAVLLTGGAAGLLAWLGVKRLQGR
jgi:hypothetical protein